MFQVFRGCQLMNGMSSYVAVCWSSMLARNYQTSSLGTAAKSLLHYPRDGTLSNCSSGSIHNRSYHALQCNNMGMTDRPYTELLSYSPASVIVQQTRYFKFKNHLKRRCKHCYFVKESGQRMVLCTEHQRHKQIKILPKPDKFWILTHATQKPKRPW